MTERSNSTGAGSASGPSHRRRREAGGSLSGEVRALVERAARRSDGLTFVKGGHLECAAVTLGATPHAVERVRAALEVPAAYAEALEIFARAAARAAGAATMPPRTPGLRGPEEVVAAARSRPDGLALLRSAAAECAAITFGVHPDVVLAARAIAGLADAAPGPVADS